MKLSKKIQRMIKRKLSFTNGWHIEEERYNELVKELTTQIILTIEEDWNRRRSQLNKTGGKQDKQN